MSNFKQDILDAAGDETISAIRILSQESHYAAKARDKVVAPFVGKTLTWPEAAPLLDYEYDDGFGSKDCHDFYAWTETRVLFVHEYDGSTSIVSVPRNPEGGKP